MPLYYFTINNTNGTFNIVLKKNNCEVIARSEDKIRGDINTVKEDINEVASSKSKERFEIYTDKSGNYRFRLKRGNGEVLLVSEPFANRGVLEEVIDEIVSTVPDVYVIRRKEDGSVFTEEYQRFFPV
ncbi:DUF1508 domain-containing protein [Ruminococcus flavefaciens]|uniref:YegP family protein n=1 Tax=Ruminococcus flavefaciens TaxID=1265 RepID=UPI00156942E7|nr:DUF1508 domain-containing protein [Ruminococcus flavefaciens]